MNGSECNKDNFVNINQFSAVDEIKEKALKRYNNVRVSETSLYAVSTCERWDLCIKKQNIWSSKG